MSTSQPSYAHPHAFSSRTLGRMSLTIGRGSLWMKVQIEGDSHSILQELRWNWVQGNDKIVIEKSRQKFDFDRFHCLGHHSKNTYSIAILWLHGKCCLRKAGWQLWERGVIHRPWNPRIFWMQNADRNLLVWSLESMFKITCAKFLLLNMTTHSLVSSSTSKSYRFSGLANARPCYTFALPTWSSQSRLVRNRVGEDVVKIRDDEFGESSGAFCFHTSQRPNYDAVWEQARCDGIPGNRGIGRTKKVFLQISICFGEEKYFIKYFKPNVNSPYMDPMGLLTLCIPHNGNSFRLTAWVCWRSSIACRLQQHEH